MNWIRKQKNILLLLGGIITGAALMVILFDLLSIRVSNFSFENEKYSPDYPTLVVGIDENYPPYEYIENGIPMGYNVDIMRAAAHAAEYNVEFIAKPWTEILEDINSGKISALSGLYINEIRQKNYIFSAPHSYVSAGIFSRKNNPIESIDDLSGNVVIVQEGDVMDDFINQKGLDTKIIYAKYDEDMIQSLINDEADAALFSSMPQGQFNIEKYNTNDIQITD